MPKLSVGADTTTQGILILDAQTIAAAYESNVLGNKVNSRFVAISGTGLKENEIIRVELGATIEKMLGGRFKANGAHRVFVNGPLCGREITDLSLEIDWSINNIVVLEALNVKVMFPMIKQEEMSFTTNILGEVRQCVYCNFAMIFARWIWNRRSITTVIRGERDIRPGCMIWEDASNAACAVTFAPPS